MMKDFNFQKDNYVDCRLCFISRSCKEVNCFDAYKCPLVKLLEKVERIEQGGVPQ